MGYEMLKLGRAIGLENLSQLRTLIKSTKSMKAGTKCVANFKLNQSQVDSYQRILSSAGGFSETQQQLMTSVKQYVPELYTPNTVHDMKIMINRPTENCGLATWDAISRNGEKVVSTGQGKVVANKAGMRVVYDQNVGDVIKINGDARIRFDEYSSLMGKNKVNAMEYANRNGITNLAADIEGEGKVAHMGMTLSAPTGYLDTLSQATSGMSSSEMVGRLMALSKTFR